tara:strand:- start:1992 stop:2987 length:996 start_codon:yes stop_codon:yes gene_type:complete
VIVIINGRNNMNDNKGDIQKVKEFVSAFNNFKKEISKVIVGQEDVVNQVLISIFSNGHCLLVGVPGLAKTLLVQTIADILGLKFNRIQFTPDLMPSDIIGTEILDESKNFKFIKGPLFANVVLADEINRTPPKTQAALLECMQERSVTSAGTKYVLDSPFFVLATQNPIEQEGTYPLPEAQLDRFMFNVILDYPKYEDELMIVKKSASNVKEDLKNIISANDIIMYQELVNSIPVNDNVLEYAVKLVSKTRPATIHANDYVNEYIEWGAGPRASQYIILAAKCNALINGKFSPDIEDVKAIAKPVLRHRIVKNYKAESKGLSIDDIIDNLL